MLAVANSPAVNVEVQWSLSNSGFVSFAYVPRVGYLSHIVALV